MCFISLGERRSRSRRGRTGLLFMYEFFFPCLFYKLAPCGMLFLFLVLLSADFFFFAFFFFLLRFVIVLIGLVLMSFASGPQTGQRTEGGA